MKLGDRVFVKDIKYFGKIASISNISISVYLDKTMEIEDKSVSFLLNGDLKNSLKLPENKNRSARGILHLIEEDFEITYPMYNPTYKTRLYKTYVDNIRLIGRRSKNETK